MSIGLLSNFDISDGLIVDLGGGSLELVHVTNGKAYLFQEPKRWTFKYKTST